MCIPVLALFRALVHMYDLHMHIVRAYQVPVSVGYRIETFDLLKYRTFDTSYRSSFVLHPLASPCFYSETARKKLRMCRISKSHRLYIIYRYRIELDSDIDIQH